MAANAATGRGLDFHPAATPGSGRLTTAALVVALGGAATLAGAWFFQLVIGLAPCPLCLEQRIPYYIAVPVALLAALLARRSLMPARLLLIVAGLLLAGGAALALYHAGVEWKWWAGPTECSGTGPVTSTNILQDLQTAHVVRCDEAAWRLFGLSLAGYNVLIASALALVALWGGLTARR
ncbi:disulfide bond formation protein B [Ancylobacter sp. 6x-1]|uniref:Disulfide bond formation protein B n=1 Tax=Ancylobacter crimeensis TaxID=2579147 RepID=A0ABT0DDQ6_9HYPH|nr:disulfide bond formation protein B [Ancylobacter crimeensis]MCK0198081.1 disulfide bond formation protein B [Ancylobacter crimeensis]